MYKGLAKENAGMNGEGERVIKGAQERKNPLNSRDCTERGRATNTVS